MTTPAATPSTTPDGINDDAARSALTFVRGLRHTKGEWAGQPFRLQPWQGEIIAQLFGRLKPDGLRQYRTAYLEIPRKQGKTELCAAIALYLLAADHEPGAEVYSAAADREQACLVFNAARQMVATCPALNKRVKVIDSQKRIIVPSTNSVYRAISSEAYSKHGFNASAVVYDELHAAPNRDLWDVLATSMGARRQPLMIAITTAGFDRESICWEQHAYAERVLSGQVVDPTFFARIYAAAESDDWSSPDTWRRANPNLGVSVREEFLAAECAKAMAIPAYQNTFRRLYLNQWTSQDVRWMDMTAWDRCGDIPVDEKALAGRTCYAGLDLSSTTDITALLLVFPPLHDGEPIWVVPRFFVPAETMRVRSSRDRVPYEEWARRGLVIATPGSAVDYQSVRDEALRLSQVFCIRELAFDRWGATQITQELTQHGMLVVPIGQGFASLNDPTKELLKLVLRRGVAHGANPVLRWMADNVSVRTDPAGNIKPDKSKSTERIDGIVALVMALARLLANSTIGEPSIGW